MNWEGCRRKRSWPDLSYYLRQTSVLLAGVWAEIWTRDLSNTKQECRSLGRDFRITLPRFRALTHIITWSLSQWRIGLLLRTTRNLRSYIHTSFPFFHILNGKIHRNTNNLYKTRKYYLARKRGWHGPEENRQVCMYTCSPWPVACNRERSEIYGRRMWFRSTVDVFASPRNY
jgi:hypothetical protein